MRTIPPSLPHCRSIASPRRPSRQPVPRMRNPSRAPNEPSSSPSDKAPPISQAICVTENLDCRRTARTGDQEMLVPWVGEKRKHGVREIPERAARQQVYIGQAVHGYRVEGRTQGWCGSESTVGDERQAVRVFHRRRGGVHRRATAQVTQRARPKANRTPICKDISHNAPFAARQTSTRAIRTCSPTIRRG